MDKKKVKYNKAFRKDYKKTFKKDPIMANMLLLFMELANEDGYFSLDVDEDIRTCQVEDLMNARFNDVTKYQL